MRRIDARERILSEEPSITTYRIDAHDVILDVDAEWLEFAELNDTPDLSRDRVVGRPLWDFIAGAEVEHLFRMIFERCRERSSGARVPFRCDFDAGSPDDPRDRAPT